MLKKTALFLKDGFPYIVKNIDFWNFNHPWLFIFPDLDSDNKEGFWLSSLFGFLAQHVSTFWPWSRAGYDWTDLKQTLQKVNVGFVSNQN